MKRKTTKHGHITTFEHVNSLQGRLPNDKDVLLLSVNVSGETDWWSVTTDLQSAIDELSLFYRIDMRGEGSLTIRQYELVQTYNVSLS